MLRHTPVWQELTMKIAHLWVSYFHGELTGFSLEHLFDDLFTLRDKFKELGMVMKDGRVYLADLERLAN